MTSTLNEGVQWNLWGSIVCCWKKQHVLGKPAFELPPTDRTNREINASLCIMLCPRCGGHYMEIRD